MDTAKTARIGRVLPKRIWSSSAPATRLDMAEGSSIFCADLPFLGRRAGISPRPLARLHTAEGSPPPDANVRRRWATVLSKEYLEYEPSPLARTGYGIFTERAGTFVITCNIDGRFACRVRRGSRARDGGHTHVDRRAASRSPDAFATAQLEELARLVPVHRNGRSCHP